jgi:hypothetical protein
MTQAAVRKIKQDHQKVWTSSRFPLWNWQGEVIGEHIEKIDLSWRILVRHFFQDLIDAGKMMLAQWLRYDGKTKAGRNKEELWNYEYLRQRNVIRTDW